MNLRKHFDAATALFNEIEESHLDSNDPAILAKVDEGIVHLEACADLVRTLAVFSANEELEDINTGDIKYILVPYYLGELVLRQVDHDRRVEHLRRSKALLEEFLDRLLAVRAVEDKEHAQLTASVAQGAVVGREERIARIKQEREVREKLKAAAERLARRERPADDHEELDEEDRDHAVLWLHTAKFGAVDTLASANQELEMLLAVEKMRGEGKGHLLDQQPEPAPAPLQTVHIPPPTNRQAYDEVMRQVHTGRIPGMHTIELDQWQQQEAQRITAEELQRQEREAFKAAQEQRKQDEPQTALEEAEELAERAKAMSFDEFKDTHARGSGNMRGRG